MFSLHARSKLMSTRTGVHYTNTVKLYPVHYTNTIKLYPVHYTDTVNMYPVHYTNTVKLYPVHYTDTVKLHPVHYINTVKLYPVHYTDTVNLHCLLPRCGRSTGGRLLSAGTAPSRAGGGGGASIPSVCHLRRVDSRDEGLN